MKKQQGDLMKYLLSVLILITPILNAKVDEKGPDKYKEQVLKILDRSVFGKSRPPESLIEGQITTYDPMMVAIASSVYSRLPGRNESRYQQVNLPPLPHSTVCPQDMRAFVKLSKRKDNKHTFVILPGAYATWKRGSFNNQTIAVLDRRFGDPNIIAFSGYLSPAFLEGTCSKIPWDAKSISKDMYDRLSIYLDQIKANPKFTGVIGYSGGGGLVPIILAADTLSVQKANRRYFGLGGASFSPTLHGRTIFNNLDASVKDIHHNNALTSIDMNQGLFLARAFFDDFELNWDKGFGLGLDWTDIVDLYDDDPINFSERSRNEFVSIDLRDTLLAVGFEPKLINGDYGYYNAYINTGFRYDQSQSFPHCSTLSSQELGFLYDEETDLRPLLAKIDRPLLIYFSQDDPVLSSWDDSGQPEAITEVLEHAKTNPHIIVFNPKYGGHIGHFLDPIFDELLYTVFSQK